MKHIEIRLPGDIGSAEGYAADTASEQVPNWFHFRHRICVPGLVLQIQATFERIAFLNNINIHDETHRQHGLGKRMLEQFENEAAEAGAQAIYLLCDLNKDHAPGFDLAEWYLKQGYEKSASFSSSRLMMLDLR